MLIPAFFVADAVRKAALPNGLTFDIIIFVEARHVTGAHREWASERGIVLCHDADIASISDIPILQPRLSSAVLVKLLIPEQLAGRYDKILWLDADLVIKGDVSAIFRLDMGARALAARPMGQTWAETKQEHKDWWHSRFQALGMTPPYRYFNAGVMLIDVGNWNRQQLTRRALDFIRKNADICILPEADALSALLNGDLLALSHIWNGRPPGPANFAGDCLQPIILHYSGSVKPWMRFRKRKGLFQDIEVYRLYQDFLRDTPWQGWLRQQWTGRDLAHEVRYEARRLLNRMLGRKRPLSQAERRAKEAIVQRYHAEAAFADVEQGITLRENGRLRLPPTQPPG
jgi:lipopolysaccharide biosynthesis glycosyltransferase